MTMGYLSRDAVVEQLELDTSLLAYGRQSLSII
jgi:hypothetical protein